MPTDNKIADQKQAARADRLTALFDAFEKETLDPAVLGPPPDVLKKKADRLKTTVSLANGISEILDEGQRKVLAARLNRKADNIAGK